MKNVLRTLVYNDEVSLTMIDSTKIVNETIRLHRLSSDAAKAFGKALTAMTFLSACLKEETGDVSVSVKGDGSLGMISLSGNYALKVRGAIGNADATGDEGDCFGRSGTIAVIRKDGYMQPFIGSCALEEEGGVDGAFEGYFQSSEQLPTFITTVVEMDGEGKCAFAGGIFLQPLPFASGETLKSLPNIEERERIVKEIRALGLENCSERYFSTKSADLALKYAEYKCNCSKEYLSGVLISLGHAELNEILKEEGRIAVHCHYCNKDYVFFQEDVDKLF